MGRTSKQQQPQAQGKVQQRNTRDGYLKYGNQDIDQDHDLSVLRVNKDDVYVVRHFNTVTTAKGRQVEDPDSSRYQVYDKDVFENYSKQGKDSQGNQQNSIFEQQGLNFEVLHKPD